MWIWEIFNNIKCIDYDDFFKAINTHKTIHNFTKVVMVCDGLWWFVMVCDGLWWFVMVCDGLWWFVMVLWVFDTET